MQLLLYVIIYVFISLHLHQWITNRVGEALFVNRAGKHTVMILCVNSN